MLSLGCTKRLWFGCGVIEVYKDKFIFIDIFIKQQLIKVDQSGSVGCQSESELVSVGRSRSESIRVDLFRMLCLFISKLQKQPLEAVIRRNGNATEFEIMEGKFPLVFCYATLSSQHLMKVKTEWKNCNKVLLLKSLKIIYRNLPTKADT